MKFNKPSSTITASGLTGLFITLVFATLGEFTDITISSTYVAATVAFFSSLVGYLKKENVLNVVDD